jgi:flavin-dependent dehydrogenase
LQPDTWDVAIVGAGPAGSSLAARLGASGWSVLLLDSARFPRDKMCGEYLGAGCLPLLRDLGVLDELLLCAHPVRFITARSPGGNDFRADYPEGIFGLSLPRRVLDSILLERARLHKSVEVREGFRAEGIVLDDGAVRGVRGRRPGGESEVLRARLTIGADGRNSVVARGLGAFRWHPRHRKLALGIHYEGVQGADQCAEIYAGRSLYGILNHQGSGKANLSIVTRQADISPWKGNLDGWFAALLKWLPTLRDRLHSARALEKVTALGPLAHQAARVSAGGALLVGDAAGFYDPFTGEGVYMALESARLAAEIAASALVAGDTSHRFLRRYDAARTASLASRYRLQHVIQAVLARPWLANHVATGLRRSPRLANALLGKIGDLK